MSGAENPPNNVGTTLLMEKDYSGALVKDGHANFIWDHRNRYMDHCNGTLQQEKEIRLNSDYSTGRWEFIARGKGEGQWTENY